MSRIGKQPVPYPATVKVELQDNDRFLKVEGPKGKLQLNWHPLVKVQLDGGKRVLTITRGDDERFSRAVHGLMRSLIANMVEGVVKGYEKKLKIEGVGYQARLEKKNVVLVVGYAEPLIFAPPEGVTAEVPDPNTIVIKGADKQKVGQFAAEVRAGRKPEPYKGKGVRYENEVVRRKEGKSFTSGG